MKVGDALQGIRLNFYLGRMLFSERFIRLKFRVGYRYQVNAIKSFKTHVLSSMAPSMGAWLFC